MYDDYQHGKDFRPESPGNQEKDTKAPINDGHSHTYSHNHHLNSQQPTPIQSLRAAMEPELVEITGFREEKITLRLRRCSLGHLLKKDGSIPNPLLGAARAMFQGGKSLEKVDPMQQREVMRTVAAAAMVEPTMKELEDADVELTDDQILEIWLYAQKGVAGIKAFRAKSGNPAGGASSEGVENQAE